MDYKFVKTFAEKIADEADVDKLIKEYKKKTDKSKKTTADKVKSSKEIAEDMIAEDKKELKRYHKYYYNMMIKALDITKQPRTLEKIKERVFRRNHEGAKCGLVRVSNFLAERM